MTTGKLIRFDEIVIGFLRVNRLGPRLKDKQLSGDSIFRPLDIHRLMLAGELAPAGVDVARVR